MRTWQEYQEEAAQFFRELGMQAETDREVEGARGRHRIDVLVSTEYIGIKQTWAVECKHWKRRVDKLHVLALANIVSDIGADRGFLLSDAGFQSGAIRAARMTNVTLTGLDDLRVIASEEIASIGLNNARRRIALLHLRLTSADDRDRASTPGSGFWVRSNKNLSVLGRLSFAEIALSQVDLNRWPLIYSVDPGKDAVLWASSRTELAGGLAELLDALEADVAVLEASLAQRDQKTE